MKGNINDYTTDIEIGHGASGVCYKALSKVNQQVCAIKKISINNIKGNSLKLALKEVEILKALNHPHIIRYYDSFIDQNYLYIVMEYAHKGDLHSLLKRKKFKQQFYLQPQIWEMARQLLQALKYLHSKNIVHRDFKTLNIFINSENKLLVGDLGVSKIIKNDIGLYSRVGTPLYLAPQIVKYQKYDYKADIWGFGCVMYVISSLTHPFQGKNIINLGQNIIYAQPKPLSNYSNELNNLFKLALQKNPLKRPEAKELLKIVDVTLAQKFKITSNLKSKEMKVQNIVSIKTEPTLDSKPKQSKYNCFFDEKRQQNSLKSSKNCKSEMELKQNRNEHKNLKGEQNFHSKQDQTLIMPQPSILNIADTPQQKTRIRTLFSAKQKHSFCKPQYCQQFVQPPIEIEQRKIVGAIDNSNKQSIKPILKIQTEPFEIVKQKLQQEKFLKGRNIQSAKNKQTTPAYKQRVNTSSQCFIKQKQSLIINRDFFGEQEQKMSHKMVPRPKSSIVRRDFTTSQEMKYVRRKKTLGEQDLCLTKTQVLRKPQVIII